MKKSVVTLGVTALTFAAAMGLQMPVQAASVKEPACTEQRAELASSNFFCPGKLGCATAGLYQAQNSKKEALLSPGVFGSVAKTTAKKQAETETQKVKILSPGQFGEINA